MSASDARGLYHRARGRGRGGAARRPHAEHCTGGHRKPPSRRGRRRHHAVYLLSTVRLQRPSARNFPVLRQHVSLRRWRHYSPPDGADDFQPAYRHIPAEPPPSAEPPRRHAGLPQRVLLFSGETTEEQEMVAQEEFQQAIAPVLEYMWVHNPDASTPEEAAHIWAEVQGEIMPDPRVARTLRGRLRRRRSGLLPAPAPGLREDPPPLGEVGRSMSHHLHGVFNKLPAPRAAGSSRRMQEGPAGSSQPGPSCFRVRTLRTCPAGSASRAFVLSGPLNPWARRRGGRPSSSNSTSSRSSMAPIMAENGLMPKSFWEMLPWRPPGSVDAHGDVHRPAGADDRHVAGHVEFGAEPLTEVEAKVSWGACPCGGRFVDVLGDLLAVLVAQRHHAADGLEDLDRSGVDGEALAGGCGVVAIDVERAAPLGRATGSGHGQLGPHAVLVALDDELPFSGPIVWNHS